MFYPFLVVHHHEQLVFFLTIFIDNISLITYQKKKKKKKKNSIGWIYWFLELMISHHKVLSSSLSISAWEIVHIWKLVMGARVLNTLLVKKRKDFVPTHKFIGLLSKWVTYLISKNYVLKINICFWHRLNPKLCWTSFHAIIETKLLPLD